MNELWSIFSSFLTKQWSTNKRLQRKRQLHCPQVSLPHRRLIYMFPQICHLFRLRQNFLDENSRYHLNSWAWMGKVWLWHKTINISWPGELLIPFNSLSLFPCCGPSPLLCCHALPGRLLLPLLWAFLWQNSGHRKLPKEVFSFLSWKKFNP